MKSLFKKENKPRGAASTQEWLPIADINSGLIYRKDRHIVAAIRVQPKNINLLSDKEKIRKVKRLEEALNGIDFPYQILSIARPVDLDAYILKLERMRSETDDIVKKKLLSIYTRQAVATVTSGEALERHFYFLTHHPIGNNPKLDEDVIKQRAIQLSSNLSSAELISHVCSDDELRSLQFIFTNPAHAAFERVPEANFSLPPVFITDESSKAGSSNEVTASGRKKKRSGRKNSSITGLLDILAPAAIEFQSKTIVSGEVYHRVIVVTNFPDRVGPGWLSRAATIPGVVMSMHVVPTDPYDLIEDIKVSMGELAAKIESTSNRYEIQRKTKQLQSAEHLIRKIDDESQGVYDVTVIFLVTAPDLDTLDSRTKRVQSILAAPGMRGRVAVFRQEAGYKSAGPYGILDPSIAELGYRNMPTETVAAAYPMVYSGINDGNGVLLGTDKDGGILLVDIWLRDGSRTNSNVTVLGRPGVGKSTVIKKILANEHARGTTIIIIDPEREYKELCENLEGDWINCGAGGKGRINPFQIRQVPLDDDDEEDPLFTKEQINRGPLALHFQFLRTFFKIYFGREVSKLEMNYFEVALEEFYREKNIVWSTDPKQLKNNDYPIMEDLFRWLERKVKQEPGKPVWEKLMMLVRPAAVGADSFLWNGPTTIEANSDFIVLDTHNLIESDKEIQQAQYFNVMSWSWNKISQDRMQRVILAGDEYYLNVDPENPEVLKFARNTSKRIRKYEGALMVITHNMNDFMDPAVRRYGQSLLDDPVYKIIMGQGENDIQSLTALMHLSEKEVETLLAGNRGEALFIAGNRRVHAKFEVSPEELALFGKGGGR